MYLNLTRYLTNINSSTIFFGIVLQFVSLYITQSFFTEWYLLPHHEIRFSFDPQTQGNKSR